MRSLNIWLKGLAYRIGNLLLRFSLQSSPNSSNGSNRSGNSQSRWVSPEELHRHLDHPAQRVVEEMLELMIQTLHLKLERERELEQIANYQARIACYRHVGNRELLFKDILKYVYERKRKQG